MERQLPFPRRPCNFKRPAIYFRGSLFLVVWIKAHIKHWSDLRFLLDKLVKITLKRAGHFNVIFVNFLHLLLHPQKIQLRTVASGIDFLGWVHFPHHCILRTATRRRMMSQVIKQRGRLETVQPYLGLLGYRNTFKVQQELLNNVWLFGDH